MKPIEFKQQNIVIAKDQPQYGSLPAFISSTPQGDVISCWEPTDEEIEMIVKEKKIYIKMLAMRKPLTPLYVTADINEFKDLFEQDAAIRKHIDSTTPMERIFEKVEGKIISNGEHELNINFFNANPENTDLETVSCTNIQDETEIIVLSQEDFLKYRIVKNQ